MIVPVDQQSGLQRRARCGEEGKLEAQRADLPTKQGFKVGFINCDSGSHSAEKAERQSSIRLG